MIESLKASGSESAVVLDQDRGGEPLRYLLVSVLVLIIREAFAWLRRLKRPPKPMPIHFTGAAMDQINARFDDILKSQDEKFDAIGDTLRGQEARLLTLEGRARRQVGAD